MKIYRTQAGPVIVSATLCYLPQQQDWDALINRDELYDYLKERVELSAPVGDLNWLARQRILAPIQNQEVWASGVTYLRSRDARMEESKQAGGDTFYDKVYEADRPEVFFKATAARTVGPDDYVRIRKDSVWDVPEPELTLFITSSAKIVAYTIGNDMSSRSIEGENPLYLPQAKSYERCAAIGPCLYVTPHALEPSTKITLQINRANAEVFNASIGIDQMKRSHKELVSYLFRECAFPHGCFLMTGTGIVPEHPFTLQQHDEILISIDHIGTLRNIVE